MLSDQKDELVQRAAAYDGSWVDGRPEDLRQYLHPDVVFAGPQLQRLVKGIEACVQSYVKFLSEARVHEFKPSDYLVDIIGGTAVMSYRWTIDYEFGGKRNAETGQDLLVWVRHDNQWLIAWRMQRSESA
jgi:hypothetical protein